MSISKTICLLALAAAICPAPAARADDLATAVAGQLRESGALSGYRVSVRSKSGTVWLEGRVSDERQLAAAVGIAEATPGVERVVNRLVIDASPAAPPARGFSLPASTRSLVGLPQPAAIEPAAASQPSRANPFVAMTDLLFAGGSRAGDEGGVQLARATQPAGRMPGPSTATARPMRPQGRPTAARMAVRTGGEYGHPMALPTPGYDGPVVDGQMVPGTVQYGDGGPVGDYAVDGGMVGGPGTAGMPGPMPMAGAGVGMPPVPMRADGPNMPNYAWPSYTAYPNYAGLQYPTQYSPTAWPYIGPFYPYPQVPLGWRRVSLEWDDGWWWLDFDDRHVHSHHR